MCGVGKGTMEARVREAQRDKLKVRSDEMNV